MLPFSLSLSHSALIHFDFFLLSFINSNDISVWWNWIECHVIQRNNSKNYNTKRNRNRKCDVLQTKKEEKQNRNADIAKKKHPQENVSSKKRNSIETKTKGTKYRTNNICLRMLHCTFKQMSILFTILLWLPSHRLRMHACITKTNGFSYKSSQIERK